MLPEEPQTLRGYWVSSGMSDASYTKVPKLWVDALSAAKNIETYRLALFLFYKRWRYPDDESVSVSNQLIRKLGLTGQQKSDALKELEGLGLIKTLGLDGIVSAVEMLKI
jgi:hypothetical protein